MGGVAQIHHLPDGAVDLTFPYDAGFIHQLKGEIPHSARTYDPRSKTWTIYPPYVAIAIAMMRQTFVACMEYVEDRSATSPPDPIRRTDPDFAILHLLPSAPPPLVEAAFRCLSKELHPDRGGKHEAMIEINAAIVRIRERRGAMA
jgi:hypothetical protein